MAQPPLGLTRQHRPDLHQLNSSGFDRISGLFSDQLAGRNQQLTVDRIVDVLESDVARDAVHERLNDVLTLLEGGHIQAQNGAAVLLRNGHILSDVDEAAREVTRVGRLQRRIG